MYRGSWWALVGLGLFSTGTLGALGYLTINAAQQKMATVVTALFLLVIAIVALAREALKLLQFSVAVTEETLSFADTEKRVEMRFADIVEITKHEGPPRGYEFRTKDGQTGAFTSRMPGFRDLERRVMRRLESRGWEPLRDAAAGTHRVPSAARARVETELEHETVDAAGTSTHTRRRERHL